MKRVSMTNVTQQY